MHDRLKYNITILKKNKNKQEPIKSELVAKFFVFIYSGVSYEYE